MMKRKKNSHAFWHWTFSCTFSFSKNHNAIKHIRLFFFKFRRRQRRKIVKMSTKLPGYNDTVICPYNKCHVILKSRIQTHLVKCARTYPDVELETCPFDVTHRYRKEDSKVNSLNQCHCSSSLLWFLLFDWLLTRFHANRPMSKNVHRAKTSTVMCTAYARELAQQHRQLNQHHGQSNHQSVTMMRIGTM